MGGIITPLFDLDEGQGHRARAVASDLTPRERQILGLMASGASNTTIGRALQLSPKTVETHIRNIFCKLQLLPNGGLDRRVAAVIAYVSAQDAPAAA